MRIRAKESGDITACLQLLAHPTRRRSGFGRQLLATATAHAATMGQRAVLDVVRDAAAPIALYEATGWSRVEPLTLALDEGRALEPWVYLAPKEGSSDPSPSGA